jgi:hypothetical protein
MASLVYKLYRNALLQKLHNSVNNKLDTALFFFSAILILGLLQHGRFTLNFTKILHGSCDRKKRMTRTQCVFLFGSKSVKHKCAHRSGMFTQFEARDSPRLAYVCTFPSYPSSQTFNGLHNWLHILNHSCSRCLWNTC